MPSEPDPGSTTVPLLIAALILLLLSAFYAAAESAMDCLSPSTLRKSAENGDKKARQLLQLLEKKAQTFSPLQVGLLMCGLPGSVLFTFALYPQLSTSFSGLASPGIGGFLAGFLSILIYLLVFSVLGDIFPKRLARHSGEKFARGCAGWIRCLMAFAQPFLSFTLGLSSCFLRLIRIDPKAWDDAVTEEEILQMVDEGEEKGVLEETEKDMIANILDFNDTTAGEIMTHRTDITAVAETASIAEVAALGVESGCSRMPVYRGDIDTVIGMCYIKDLLSYVGKDIPEDLRLKDLMRPAYFIPESKKCSALFTEMTERKVQIAIVVDEYGGTAGLITLEDLVESIVGNIQDEYDNEEEEIHQVSETAFTVDGNTSIDEISDLTGVELPEGDYDTLAGLVTQLLGRIPGENERPQVQIGRLTVTVLQVADQRLAKLLVIKEPIQEEENKPGAEPPPSD